jgi:hypothetical protein
VPKVRIITHPVITERTLWHPYILQSLSTSKFESVVAKILKGECVMLKIPHIERFSEDDVPILDPIAKLFQ